LQALKPGRGWAGFDDDLRRIWGENLYRVLVTSSAPTDGGAWKIEVV
jgi:hypothetical protein